MRQVLSEIVVPFCVVVLFMLAFAWLIAPQVNTCSKTATRAAEYAR